MQVSNSYLYGLGNDSDICASALRDAQKARPGWTPNDAPFGGSVTCLDPGLSPAQAKACKCAGKWTTSGADSKYLPQAEESIPDGPPQIQTNLPPDSNAPSSGGGGLTWLIAAGLAAKFLIFS